MYFFYYYDYKIAAKKCPNINTASHLQVRVGTIIMVGIILLPFVQHGNQTVDEKMQLISQRKGLLSNAMRGLKSAITRFANSNKITFGWQERF